MKWLKAIVIGGIGLALLVGCNEVPSETENTENKGSAPANGQVCKDPTAGFVVPVRANRCSREKVFAALDSFEIAHASLDTLEQMDTEALEPHNGAPTYYEEIQSQCENKEGLSHAGGLTLEKNFEGASCPVSFHEVSSAHYGTTACIEQEYSVNAADLQAQGGFLSSQLRYRSVVSDDEINVAKAGTFTTLAYGKAYLSERKTSLLNGQEDADGRSSFHELEISFDDCNSKLKIAMDAIARNRHVELDGVELDPATIPTLRR